MAHSDRPPMIERAAAGLPTIVTVLSAVAGGVWWLSGLLYEQRAAVERVNYTVQSMDQRVTRVEAKMERIVVRLPDEWMTRTRASMRGED